MIKAIVLDVDGVIVGEKVGYNSPDPHVDVISALKKIRSKGIPIVLCTAKPHFSIGTIIKKAGLDNLHIADGGAVVINPLKNRIVVKHIIPQSIATQALQHFLENEVYVEFYTVDDYFIQKDQVSGITKQHEHILQKAPRIVDSLVEASEQREITKIMPIAKGEQDKQRLQVLFEKFVDQLSLSWGVHPVALPLQFGIVTAPGISKENAAQEIVRQLGIDFENVLGVGDSTSDWQFIQYCGYRVAMGNASEKLKWLVKSKDEDKSFISPGVDENGILEVFKRFKLL